MTYALPQAGGDDRSGPAGYTYAGVLTRSADRAAVLALLRELEFTGWLAPPDDGGWLAAVCAAGTVASGRRGVVGVGEAVAGRLPTPTLAFLVNHDRQLLLVVWDGGEEVGRYLSDPSYGHPSTSDILPDPLGVESAEAFAAACGRPEAGEELTDLLGEELDPDSVIESERLAGVLRLLGLPRWLISAWSLPKEILGGPDPRALTQLRAGATGLVGLLYGPVKVALRKRRPPPAAITDAPVGEEIDPWLM